jgi:hypothetical protein
MKNIFLIKRKTDKIAYLIIFIAIAIAIIFKKTTFIYSVILASLFSYIIFNNMINTQISILKKKNIKAIYIGYILRLIFYAIPLILALQEKEYFNFYVILVFLMLFQGVYFFAEIIRFIRRAVNLF